MKDKSKEEKLVKCEFCKKKLVTFYIHECKFSCQEYYGCKNCDNWCIKCKDNWDNNDDKNQ